MRALHTGRGRDEAGAFLVEGPQAVREALRAGTVRVMYASTPAFEQWRAAAERAGLGQAQIVQVSDAVIEAMAETRTPQGLLAICDIPADIPVGAAVGDAAGEAGPLVLLDGIADPGNAGTIIRTAHAVGAAAVLFAEGSVDPFNGKCVRATAGSIFHTAIARGVDAQSAVRALQAAGVTVAAATGAGEADLLQWVPGADGRICWVFGSEAHGVSRAVSEAASVRVRIPMPGGAESLNAASAAAVCLYADLARSHGTIAYGAPDRKEP